MRNYIFQSIIEHATDAVIVTDVSQMDSPDGPCIVFVNDAYVKLTGYSKEEVIGKTPRILQGPETDRKELDKLRHALKSGEPGHAEIVNYKKSGEKFWTSISIFPVKYKSPTIKYWVGIKRDITAQRKAFEEVNTTLQELHHRVKNNLALISALMELQVHGEDSALIKSKLLACTARIKSIAEIHELLYKGESLTHIDMNNGIKVLINSILSTLQPEIEINSRFNVHQIDAMNINQAVPFSLIVNEIITNSINHAFKEMEKGKINIELSQKNNQITLKLQDNGRGFPQGFNPHEIISTGMVLIKTLSNQLNAKFNFVYLEKGTEFNLQFMLMDIKGAHSSFKTSE